MKKYLLLLSMILLVSSCRENKSKNERLIQGRVKRQTLSISSKLPGRLLELRVSEGDFVKKGQILALLDVPEIEAKLRQARGVLKAADAQYDMAKRGATPNQLRQLQAQYDGLREQYLFAQKSIARLKSLVDEHLIARQKYDEAFAKLKGAKAQMDAAFAQLQEAQKGTREEQKTMAHGQKERALGALEEADIAAKERTIIAPSDMTLENIVLQPGELITPGYTLFSGYLPASVYFRFTLPESKIHNIRKGSRIMVHDPHINRSSWGATITLVKPLTSYADISTAYPDYDIGEVLYEVNAQPLHPEALKFLLTNSIVTIEL